MKLWQSLLLNAVLLVVAGLMICDDVRTHNALKTCEKAKPLKSDTVIVVTPRPRDSQPTTHVGVHPISPTVPKQGTPHLTASKPSNADSAMSTVALPCDTPAGGAPARQPDTNCVTDTTDFQDGERIIHSLCSPDFPEGARIVKPIWTIRELPNDTSRTARIPIIIEKTPWYSHWYVEAPKDILIALLAGYGGVKITQALTK